MNRRIGLNVFASAMVLLVWAPPLLGGHYPLAALVVRSFFYGLCHQDPARSFLLNGEPAAVCIRCFGIYLGAFLGVAVNLWPGAGERMKATWTRHILLGTVLLNVADVVAEQLRWHGNLPVARFFFGIALGMAIGVLLTCGGKQGSENRGQGLGVRG
jgi:uncharacterized membrane protein